MMVKMLTEERMMQKLHRLRATTFSATRGYVLLQSRWIPVMKRALRSRLRLVRDHVIYDHQLDECTIHSPEINVNLWLANSRPVTVEKLFNLRRM